MSTDQAISQDERYDELAEKLIAAHLENNLATVLAQLRPQLADPIMNAIGRRLSVIRHRDPVQTDAILDLSKTISVTLGSKFAQGIYLWHEASVGIFHNRYGDSLMQLLEAEKTLIDYISVDQFVSLQANIIGLMIYLGQYEDAFDRAKTVLERKDIDYSRHLARIYTNVALGQKNLGNLDTAEALYHQAAMISHTIGDSQHEAIVAGNLAVVQREQGKIKDARESLIQCRTYFQANNFVRELARTNITLGLIEARTGNHQLGTHYLNLARLDFEAMDLHAEQATVAIYQAILHLNTNLLSDAHQAIDFAIELLHPLGLKWHLALALLVKGLVLKSSSHLGHSSKILKEAQTLFEEIGSKKYATLVQVEIAENLDVTEALAVFANSSELMLSSIPYVQSRLAVMKPRFQLIAGQAREAINTLMGPDGDGIASLDSKQQIVALQIVGDSFAKLGQKCTARQHYLAACRIALFLCQHMYTDELTVAFLNGNSSLFARLADLSFELFHNDSSKLDDLFFALNIADKLKPSSANQTLGVDHDKFRRIENELYRLREQWYWLDLQNEALLSQSTNSGFQNSYIANMGERVKLEQEITQRMRIRESLFRLDHALTDNQVDAAISTSTVEEGLRPGEYFVQFFGSGSQIHAFVINAYTTLVNTGLCPRDKIARLAKTWRFLTYSQGELTDRGVIVSVLEQLYDLLIRPLDLPLHSCTRLNIRLPDFIHDLPIHAFHDGNQFLIQCTDVVYQQSTRLPETNYTFEGKRQGLIIGNDFSGTLPEVHNECQDIADILQPMIARISYLDTISDIAAFCQALENADFVHFACHGTFREDNALFSKLYLGSRPITALDLSNVRFANNPLIVINACRSGRGTTAASFSNGFVSNFLRQGAASVVATQWKIKDDLARMSSVNFYQNLKICASPVTALNQSQRIAIQNNIPVFDWAAYKVWAA